MSIFPFRTVDRDPFKKPQQTFRIEFPGNIQYAPAFKHICLSYFCFDVYTNFSISRSWLHEQTFFFKSIKCLAKILYSLCQIELFQTMYFLA
jgi:hypothetical protein